MPDDDDDDSKLVQYIWEVKEQYSKLVRKQKYLFF